MQRLQDARVVFVDSTFRVVPALFYQLFTIFVPHADYSFPMCYALMTRKTTDLYRAVLERLHQLAPQFAPTQLIADFEDAPTAAFRVVFGEQLQISGCWFHYAQVVIRRMKKLGLQKAYTTDEQTQLAFRCVLSLPLLPCNDIEPGLGDVKLLDIDDSASNQLMQQLFRYVERHWIKKSSIGPSRLSVRDNTSQTNNAMESFHAALRQRVKVAHPNLFTFLGHLKRVHDEGRGCPICRADITIVLTLY